MLTTEGAGHQVKHMSQDLPLADELAAVFARMAGLLLSDETVHTALKLVTELAEETVGGVGAGVTLVDEQGNRTMAATDPVAERADGLQYELGEGPCLTAVVLRTTVRVDDTVRDERWPRWSEAVAALGIRSSLTAPLVAGGTVLGALKVYSDQLGAYPGRAEYLLMMFAAQAAILLANVRSHENARRLSDRLVEAMRSRDLVGIAKGIVMARDGVDEQAGFAALVARAQREHTSVHDVAAALVRSVVRRGR